MKKEEKIIYIVSNFLLWITIIFIMGYIGYRLGFRFDI